jgi:DNA replication protein DnaC
MLHETIREQLKLLGFKGMLPYFDEMLELNKDQHLPWQEIFLSLLKSEMCYRQTRSFMYRLGLAKLPQLKSLDNFNLEGLPMNPEILAKTKSLTFINDHHNLLIIGGSGSGKTHLALGLAQAALQKNYRIRFYKFVNLARALLMAEQHNYQASLMARLQNFHLLIVDEFGYLPIDIKASPLLFELFSNLYEKTSILLTTHLTFDEWGDIFGNPKSTKAIIDRVTHHCLILETGNKSWRLKEGNMRQD